MSLKSPFLIGVQETMRMRGYSIRTEKTYLYWTRHSLTFTTSVTPKQWERKKLHNF
ncbi:phage integrase N-terminal SAM-like domain-containing protein [Vibrio fluvialis]|nr:phage integrase N-terminal SAM-like domain-containing protein [Vibrio fluvialis]ELO1814568.1 phage integrase N-terminal SAM-like domain-containing protein [Vibrio fluvialis]